MDRRETLELYRRLRQTHPQLFRRGPDFGYQLVPSLDEMREYSNLHQVALGVHSETPYSYLVVDLVRRHPDPAALGPFPYQRLVVRSQAEGARGIVVVAVNESPDLGPLGALFLAEQDRHATGRRHLETVRGFGEKGHSAEQSAARELGEELGVVARAFTPLGELHIDPGFTDAVADVVLAHVSGRLEERKLEAQESIGPPTLMTPRDVKRAIAGGGITDSLTISALCRYFLWAEDTGVTPAA
jgi:8-oxo-dGTP pyrophosphatase MutT (NUDIX family)